MSASNLTFPQYDWGQTETPKFTFRLGMPKAPEQSSWNSLHSRRSIQQTRHPGRGDGTSETTGQRPSAGLVHCTWRGRFTKCRRKAWWDKLTKRWKSKVMGSGSDCFRSFGLHGGKWPAVCSNYICHYNYGGKQNEKQWTIIGYRWYRILVSLFVRWPPPIQKMGCSYRISHALKRTYCCRLQVRGPWRVSPNRQHFMTAPDVLVS